MQPIFPLALIGLIAFGGAPLALRTIASSTQAQAGVNASLASLPQPDEYRVLFWSDRSFTLAATQLHFRVTDLRGNTLANELPFHAQPAKTRFGPPGVAQQTEIPIFIDHRALPPGMSQIVMGLSADVTRQDGSHVTIRSFERADAVNLSVAPSSEATELRVKYEGRDVYTYGPIALDCTVPESASSVMIFVRAHSRLRIARLRRVEDQSPVLRAGSSQFGLSDSAFEYKAIGPVQVTFDPTVRPQISGMSFSEPVSLSPRDPAFRTLQHAHVRSVTSAVNAGHCSEIRTYVSGRWDFGRLFTTERPSVRSDIRLGMSHQEVAFIAGFPSIYGTKSELFALDEWDYALPAPFSFDVRFAHDRVVAYHPPGNLP